MVFTKRLREGVRSGAITTSIRIWKRPNVMVGKRYAMEDGQIEIESIDQIAIQDINHQMAVESGFLGVIDLLKVATARLRRQRLPDPLPLHPAAQEEGKVTDVSARLIGALACSLLATPFFAQQLEEAFDGAPEHPAIHYQTGPVNDPVSALSRRIQSGEVKLTLDGPQGYLRSVLQALHVPVESQMVVFSKTSVQRDRISPTHPRVLYFNDSVIVGWVPGGFIEIASQDTEQGAVFYTLAQRSGGAIGQAMNAMSPPAFVRGNGCLTCHLAYGTMGVAGMLVRSTIPSRDGMPIRPFGEYLTDQRSPFAERWGGWYVTGKSAPKNLGNITADPAQPEPAPENKLPQPHRHRRSRPASHSLQRRSGARRI